MADDLDELLKAGWEELDAGALDAARALCERARQADPRAPEVDVLAGAIAGAAGDADAARKAYRRAMKTDPDYFEPVYLLAHLEAQAGELEKALELTERALDLAEEEDEFVDALIMQAELELALDDPDAAAETLAELPPVDLPEASFHARAGRCFLDLDDVEAAERHYQAAARLDPDDADAWHGLGLVAEARGDEARKIECFRKVRAIDLKAPPVPWAVSVEALERAVEAALAELPERARALLGNVPIVVEDYPSEALVQDGVDPRSLGIFSGVPYPEQSTLSGQPPHLECVQLYKRNLERDARTPEEVEDEIRTTLLHETGHFFGLDEADLAALGLD